MKISTTPFCGIFLLASLSSITCVAKVWNVGPTRTYTLPSQVAGLVADGDIVEIDAADYTDCASWNANNLTLRGIGGRPHLKNKVCAGKGIWNLNALNTTIENIEFSGATNPDQNGAGIRGVGGGFTVRNCSFHHNDDGILAAPAGPLTSGQGSVVVEYCEFFDNGFGDGQSHNLYINHFQNFTLQYCHIHGAKVGHEVKSRAYNNYILYNRISDASSDASRSIDLPNGGNAYLIGNVIEQGPNSANSNMIGYGLEGLNNPAPHNLFLVNNTLVNNRSTGSFVMVQAGTGTLKVVNTIFAGNGTVISGTAATLDSASNLIRASIASVGFKDPLQFDYTLTASSPAINKGTTPGTSGTFALTALAEYVHPMQRRDRVSNGTIDIGSYEFHTNPLSLVTLHSHQMAIDFFPNPFQYSFTLRVAKAAERIILTDLFGNEVVSKYHLAEGHSIQAGNELLSGMYLLTVYFTTGELETTRIVKAD